MLSSIISKQTNKQHSCLLRFWGDRRHFNTADFKPTVYALSTPYGIKSAISVVRISGSDSLNILKKLGSFSKVPESRTAVLRSIYTYPEKILLDKALVFYFKGPKSYTGEDMLELHLHGSKSIVNTLFKTLNNLSMDSKNNMRIRMAEPGEFSKRAFLNGKMDLTELEGIRDIIDSETELERRSALKSFVGENKKNFELWRAQILNAMMKMTAIIDFSEDANLEDVNKILDSAKRDIDTLYAELNLFIEKINKTRFLKNGIRIALLGEPNVGKSSLINRISSDDELAIVSDIAGTTRDSIDSILDLDGFKVIITDTAGIRSHTLDEIEMIGIMKSKKKFSSSDIALLMVDPSTNLKLDSSIIDMVNSGFRETPEKEVFLVVNKCDLVKNEDALNNFINDITVQFDRKMKVIKISCSDKQAGIQPLMAELRNTFEAMTSGNGSEPVLVSTRVHEILTQEVIYGLNDFYSSYYNKDVLIASESLNLAASGLGSITGDSIDADEVLGTVFSNFCIGK